VKKYPASVLVLMLLSFAGVLSAADLVTIRPEKPRLNDTLYITYNMSDKLAALKDVSSMTLQALFVREDDIPDLKEVEMKRSGTEWNGSLAASGDKLRLILFQFVSGEAKDDSGQHQWETMIYGADGKPLQNAYALRSGILRGYRFPNFTRAKNPDAAEEAAKQELALYPDNWQGSLALYSVWLTPEKMPEKGIQAAKGLPVLLEKVKNNELAVAAILPLYERLGQKQKADSLRRIFIAANPKGKVAETTRINEIYSTREALIRASLIEKFCADFSPATKDLLPLQNALVVSYVSGGDLPRAARVIDSLQLTDPSLCNRVAWALLEKDLLIDRAVAIARRGVDAARNSDPATKPSYQSLTEWKSNLKMILGMVLDTYGYGLSKQKRNPEAESALEEACALVDSSDSEMNGRLIASYAANKKYDRAMSFAVLCIERGKGDSTIMAQYRNAFKAAKGSLTGFDKAVQRAKDLAKQSLKKKLMNDRLDQPSIDFTLFSPDGKKVTLSKLKGKVVVLDFWATWCGPCKNSFPYLEKIYRKYKSNKQVAVLAMNTWERLQGAEREQAVRDFLKANKYTFPVVYDSNFVAKYGVEGIPTKFIIDKNGRIQFKSVGFENGEGMTNELTMQIDMLLEQKTGKNTK
jgi:thiol-disulfide isomerase/thioredoxin